MTKEKSNPSLHSSSGRTAVLYSAGGGSSPSEGSCTWCKQPLTKRWQNKYCSNTCQRTHISEQIINDWLEGKSSGIATNGNTSSAVKKWLRRTRGDRCELCGWSEINPTTGIVPVVADHIDGNWQNNRPENLRLICPNCDSLQPTYKALNKGNGRSSKIRKRD